MFSFRLWLEDQEEYDRLFSNRAKEAFYKSKDYFSKWFPEHLRRLYIPLKQNKSFSQYFRSNDFIAPEDDEVIKGLAQLGYEVTDYRAGYVKRGQGKEKLGGVLSRLIATTKEQDKKQLYSKWLKQFSISSSRSGKNLSNSLWVIISRNPHDIAQMSYDRDWLSCMELKDGMYRNTPFCVIKSGGMVAYLLNKSEAEVKQLVISEWEPIEKPLARISIKAAKNVKDPSIVIAIPEETIYGANISGFWETVKGWLEERQGDVGSGRFKILGGYTDSLGKTYQNPPKDEHGLMNWLDSNISGRTDAAINYILNNHTKIKSQEIWDKMKQLLKLSYNNDYDLSPEEEKLIYLIHIKPEMFTNEEIDKFPFNIRERLNRIGKEDRLITGILKSYRGEMTTPHGGKTGVAKILDEHDLNRVLNLLDTGDHGSINQVSVLRLIRFLDLHIMTIRNIKDRVFGNSVELTDMSNKLKEQFVKLTKSVLKMDFSGKSQAQYYLIYFILNTLELYDKFPSLEDYLIKTLEKMPVSIYSTSQLDRVAALQKSHSLSPENNAIISNIHNNLMRMHGQKA